MLNLLIHPKKSSFINIRWTRYKFRVSTLNQRTTWCFCVFANAGTTEIVKPGQSESKASSKNSRVNNEPRQPIEPISLAESKIDETISN